MIIREHSAGSKGGIKQGSLISIDETFRSLEIVDSPLHARPHRAIVRTSGGGKYSFDICRRAYTALREHFRGEIEEEIAEEIRDGIRDKIRREERQRAERIVARRMDQAREEIIDV